MNGLLELMTTKMWMVSPDFAHAVRGLIEMNLNTHAVLEGVDKKVPFAAKAGMSSAEIVERQVTESGNSYSQYELGDMEAPFVNVMPVEGPITRNGGACTYGSVELRDMMMRAADHELCRGHLFLINTPGGSAWAKNDFQQAIDYARAKGQPILAFIDGTCCSAGMYLAAMCDEVYVMHPKDQIGCIGVMAAFYTQKDGSYCQYSNETYHEIYDPESSDKNKEVRDIANDDDDKLLVEELAKLGMEFREVVKASFPAATDEHIKGKVFNAEDVYGILCDGQSTYGDVLARVFDLADGAEKVTRPVADMTVAEKPEMPGDPDDDDDHDKDDPEKDDPEDGCKPKKKSENINNHENMKKYEMIAAACGVEELVVTEEGTHLNTALCDALQQRLSEDAAKIENMATEHAKAIEQLNAKHDEEVKATKEANDRDITALNEANKKLEEEKAELDKQLAESKAALDTKTQELKDMEARLDASLHQPSAQEEETPAGDAEQVADKQEVFFPAYDPEKSPQENARIRKEYMEKCKNA